MQSRRGAAGPFPYPNSGYQESRFTAPPGSRQKGHRQSYRELFYAFPLGRGYIHHMGLQTTPHFDASIHRTATEAPACMVVLYGGELRRPNGSKQTAVTRATQLETHPTRTAALLHPKAILQSVAARAGEPQILWADVVAHNLG
jgi:hypothetical protein